MAVSGVGETARGRFHPASLDALNFLLADVRGALGPYLNVFLVTQQHWSLASVGLVTAIGGWVGLAVQTPVGAAIDATRAKRALIIAALAVLGVGAVTIYAMPTFWPVMIANALIAMVGDVFAPAVAALTLGLVAKAQLAQRLGRNSAWDHAGNVAIAAAAGAVGWAFSQRIVFLLVPVFAVLASGAVLSIPAGAIDHDRARGADEPEAQADGAPHTSGLPVLLTCRPLLVYSACAMLFHFANAPLLPLVGQKLALAHKELATAMMSACIIAAQAIMLPIAVFVGHTADSWGRKPILLLGFAILPIRAALYTLSDNSAWLIGVQLLDGVGAGIFGAITPLVLADLMRGTGRYNVAQGGVATLQGIGAATSGLVVGLIVDNFGYTAAFFEAASVASIAFLVLLLLMPETAETLPAPPPDRGHGNASAAARVDGGSGGRYAEQGPDWGMGCRRPWYPPRSATGRMPAVPTGTERQILMLRLVQMVHTPRFRHARVGSTAVRLKVR